MNAQGTMELEILKRAIVETLNVDPSEISENTTFLGDLCADSLDVYQMVMFIEEDQGIELSADNVEKITTVGEAVELIKRAKKKAEQDN